MASSSDPAHVVLWGDEHTALGRRSEKLDFNGSDHADEDELNDILWLAIRGTNPPAPVRSAFAR